jgi:dTDP-4-dehydrorhamnose 3,5-epimerase
MRFLPTRIPEVVVVEPKVFEDDRGFFLETWHANKFLDANIDVVFVQDNHSASRQWVLRGLHYQLRNQQGKLVRAIRGEVFDVAVDLRMSSPTFGRWVGQRLSAANRLMLWIPPGFAHGFLVLSESAEVIYKCTDFYNPDAERALIWSDPTVAIDWPLPPGTEPIVSSKDRLASSLQEAEYYP